MSDGFIGTAIEVIGGILVTICGGFVTRHAIRLDKMQADHERINQDLSNYKLDSEKRFAKEETMQASLARIHDRLDLHAAEAREASSEIHNDIKTLILKFGSHS